jgi:hypothetical protein
VFYEEPSGAVELYLTERIRAAMPEDGWREAQVDGWRAVVRTSAEERHFLEARIGPGTSVMLANDELVVLIHAARDEAMLLDLGRSLRPLTEDPPHEPGEGDRRDPPGPTEDGSPS